MLEAIRSIEVRIVQLEQEIKFYVLREGHPTFDKYQERIQKLQKAIKILLGTYS